MVVYRLGFKPIWKNGRMYMVKPAKFLAYIKPFTKIFADNDVMKKIL
jgi:hypothetical protein